MERVKPPKQEESPEETGEKIIRKLLDAPSPPQTLEEDLLETNMRIAQKEIIPLQLAMEQQKHRIRASVAADLEKYFREHPPLTREHRRSQEEAANAFMKKQIDELKAHTKKRIEDLHAIRKSRDAAIRTFCSSETQLIAPAA
ncbi:hypothetical protein HYT95_00835 [Candidatus Peregrinibacteria bacterium]|nr:hypothetical protein [Candidatus Peregrinibacteria bacterium]